MTSSDLDPEVARVELPGPPRYGWFAGVIEGRVSDYTPLRAAVRRIQRLDIVGCDLEVDGGRFSFLFDEAPVSGPKLTQEAQADLVDGLQAVISASSHPAEIESTLRCSLVYGEEVVETLLAPVDGELKPISRRRPLDERDRAAGLVADPGPQSGMQSLGAMSLGRGLALLLLVLMCSALVGWQTGYIGLLRDAYYSRPAEELVISYGPFRDTLIVTVESRFAKYECKVSRGPGYPATADAVEALIEDAVTSEDRAAANAVGNGGVIWLRLLAVGDESDETVDSVKVNLSPLLTEDDGAVSASLRARLRGTQIELALNSGRSKGAGKKGSDD